MLKLWQEFLSEKDANNVSPRTLTTYGVAWHAWGSLLPEDPSELTRTKINAIIVAMRERKNDYKPGEKIRTISVITYLRVLRTFVRWLHECEYIKAPVRITIPRGDQDIPRTFTNAEVTRMLKMRPENPSEKRVLLLMQLILDTGLRVSEALALKRKHIDLAKNTILVELGKGRKTREVPFGDGLRRVLREVLRKEPEEYIFSTRTGNKVDYSALLKYFVKMNKRIGITGARVSYHTLRHTFATNYIRTNGNVLSLQRILGHTTLDMTRRYVTLQTEDLVQGHGQHSYLGV